MESLIADLLDKLNITKQEFTIVSDNFYRRVENGGDLSLIVGEGYMAGEWRSNDLASFMRKVVTVDNFSKHIYSIFKSHPIHLCTFKPPIYIS